MTNDHNSPDELLAVVDAENREIGAEPRWMIHERKLLHRAVHVLLRDEQGRILIQKRSDKKDLFPLHWECVGGHLSLGERYEDAAYREVLEELGTKACNLEFVTRIAASEVTAYEFIEVFQARAEGPLRPDPAEVIAIEWVSPEQLKTEADTRARQFSPIFLNTLKCVAHAIWGEA